MNYPTNSDAKWANAINNENTRKHLKKWKHEEKKTWGNEKTKKGKHEESKTLSGSPKNKTRVFTAEDWKV